MIRVLRAVLVQGVRMIKVFVWQKPTGRMSAGQWIHRWTIQNAAGKFFAGDAEFYVSLAEHLAAFFNTSVMVTDWNNVPIGHGGP